MNFAYAEIEQKPKMKQFELKQFISNLIAFSTEVRSIFLLKNVISTEREQHTFIRSAYEMTSGNTLKSGLNSSAEYRTHNQIHTISETSSICVYIFLGCLN